MPTNVAFEKQTPIRLKCTTAQTKIISLKQIKVVPKKANIPDHFEPIKIDLKQSYEEILEKLENGSLSFEDLLEKSKEEINNEPSTSSSEQPIEETPVQVVAPTEEPELETKYKKLKQLALRPVKRVPSPELVAACDSKYNEKYEYHNLERQVLQPSDFFRQTIAQVDENTLNDAVDVDRSKLYGIIPSNTVQLTDKDKELLLSMENFDNLSLAARYYVLKMQIEKLNEFIAKACQSKLMQKDKFGRTPIDTLETYQKLANALENKINISDDSV